jgi:hypothetical protein
MTPRAEAPSHGIELLLAHGLEELLAFVAALVRHGAAKTRGAHRTRASKCAPPTFSRRSLFSEKGKCIAFRVSARLFAHGRRHSQVFPTANALDSE